MEKQKKSKKKVEQTPDDMYHPTGATYLGEGMYMDRNGNIVEGKDLW